MLDNCCSDAAVAEGELSNFSSPNRKRKIDSATKCSTYNGHVGDNLMQESVKIREIGEEFEILDQILPQDVKDPKEFVEVDESSKLGTDNFIRARNLRHSVDLKDSHSDDDADGEISRSFYDSSADESERCMHSILRPHRENSGASNRTRRSSGDKQRRSLVGSLKTMESFNQRQDQRSNSAHSLNDLIGDNDGNDSDFSNVAGQMSGLNMGRRPSSSTLSNGKSYLQQHTEDPLGQAKLDEKVSASSSPLSSADNSFTAANNSEQTPGEAESPGPGFGSWTAEHRSPGPFGSAGNHRSRRNHPASSSRHAVGKLMAGCVKTRHSTGGHGGIPAHPIYPPIHPLAHPPTHQPSHSATKCSSSVAIGADRTGSAPSASFLGCDSGDDISSTFVAQFHGNSGIGLSGNKSDTELIFGQDDSARSLQSLPYTRETKLKSGEEVTRHDPMMSCIAPCSSISADSDNFHSPPSSARRISRGHTAGTAIEPSAKESSAPLALAASAAAAGVPGASNGALLFGQLHSSPSRNSNRNHDALHNSYGYNHEMAMGDLGTPVTEVGSPAVLHDMDDLDAEEEEGESGEGNSRHAMHDRNMGSPPGRLFSPDGSEKGRSEQKGGRDQKVRQQLWEDELEPEDEEVRYGLFAQPFMSVAEERLPHAGGSLGGSIGDGAHGSYALFSSALASSAQSSPGPCAGDMSISPNGSFVSKGPLSRTGSATSNTFLDANVGRRSMSPHVENMSRSFTSGTSGRGIREERVCRGDDHRMEPCGAGTGEGDDPDYSGVSGETNLSSSSHRPLPDQSAFDSALSGATSSDMGSYGGMGSPARQLVCPPTPQRAAPHHGHSLLGLGGQHGGDTSPGEDHDPDEAADFFSFGLLKPLDSVGDLGRPVPIERQNSLMDTKLLLAQTDGDSRGSVVFNRDFQHLGLIGSGTFADVYRVQELPVEGGGADRQYAVKKSKRQFRSKREREWLMAEVRTMKLLGQRPCPYVVPLIRAWQEDSYFYVQMGYAERGTLKDLLQHIMELQHIAIPDSAVWHVVHDVAAGLQHIHDCNIVHLDIKPANLLVNSLGLIMIGDFGMSAQIGSHEDGQEGDTRYMAKELLNNPARLPSADIFSFGLTLYEICRAHEADKTIPAVGSSSMSGSGSEGGVSRDGDDGGSVRHVKWVRLPSEGPLWRALREGRAEPLQGRPDALARLVHAAMSPSPDARPSAADMLAAAEVNCFGKVPDSTLLSVDSVLPAAAPPPIQRSVSFNPVMAEVNMVEGLVLDVDAANAVSRSNTPLFTPKNNV